MTYLLDTNVLSETRRARPHAGVTAWLQLTPARSLFVSVLTLGEIARGITLLAERGDRRQADALSGWLDQLIVGLEDRVLPVTAGIVRTWGQLPRRLSAPAVDGLLAATALVHGHTMVTRNTQDMLSTGVPLLDPFEG